jgi:hypothetical protein
MGEEADGAVGVQFVEHTAVDVGTTFGNTPPPFGHLPFTRGGVGKATRRFLFTRGGVGKATRRFPFTKKGTGAPTRLSPFTRGSPPQGGGGEKTLEAFRQRQADDALALGIGAFRKM